MQIVCEQCGSQSSVDQSSVSELDGVECPQCQHRQAVGKTSRAAIFQGADRKKWIVLGVGILVLLSALGIVISKRPWARRAPTLAAAAANAQVDQVIERWRLLYIDLKDSSDEYTARGEAELAKDTSSGYAAAQAEFQKAVIVDPDNDRAVAGYVNALALDPDASLDDRRYEEALSLIAAAEMRRGADALELIAHANLLLTRSTGGNASDARALAERAKEGAKPEEQAQAYLAIGRSHLATNVIWAAEQFDKAFSLVPSLKRGLIDRARGFHGAGDIPKAIETLKQRLSLDPDQWEATELLARIYVEAGQTALARQVLEKLLATSPKQPRAKIALAMLAYQHEGRRSEAKAALRALADSQEKLGNQMLAEVLVHLATIQRIDGELDEARLTIKDAISADESYAPAHLQALIIELQAGKAAQAREPLTALQGRLGDPALEKLLEGQVLLLEEKYAEAMEAFAKSAQLDARRTDAWLLAGAAAAKANNERKAYEYALQHGLRGDPERSMPLPVMARGYLQPSDLLRPAVGQFFGLSTGRDDPNPHLCEALVRFHLGELAEADRELTKVISIDTGNGPALAFKSLIELRRGKEESARKWGARAAGTDRSLGLAHYALGSALLASKKVEAAKSSLRLALAQDPKLLASRMRLGAAYVQSKDLDDASKLLMGVITVDSSYLEAKRALFALVR